MGIKKGRWVDGRYVDGNGNEIIPPVSERPKGYKPPTGMVNGVEKKDINEPVVSVREILEDLEKKKKRYKKPEDLEKNKIHYPKLEDEENKSFKDLFIIWRKIVFTVPVLTMIGVWIIVYYQVTSHNHYSRGGGTYKSISGSVRVNR